MQEENKIIRRIAVIRTDFKEKFGVPRQSGRAPSAKGVIVFEPEYRLPEALRNIEDFTYLWLIFGFDRVEYNAFSPTVRPPRLGGNERAGVFATRSPFRPNGLGLSSVKLESVEKTEKDGTVLVVSGVDMVDGTPIYDVKPYLPYTDSHPDAQCGFAGEHFNHKLKVDFPERLRYLVPKDKIDALIECLSDDPRPSYQNDGRTYGFTYCGFNVSFTVESDVLTVTAISTVTQ